MKPFTFRIRHKVAQFEQCHSAEDANCAYLTTYSKSAAYPYVVTIQIPAMSQYADLSFVYKWQYYLFDA